MSLLQNPIETNMLPHGYRSLKKGVTKTKKIEGKICSERAAKAMEKKTVLRQKL